MWSAAKLSWPLNPKCTNHGHTTANMHVVRRAAAAILKERSEGLLVVLDSLDYSTNFRGARLQPPSLPVSGRLVDRTHL